MTQEQTWFGQANYGCRLEWGGRGARAAAERGDILVVVDVLSFSTAVATAVENGALVYPCGKDEDAEALAGQWEAAMAVRREDVPARGRYSLSPETFRAATPGERIVLPSPNGAVCSRYGSHTPLLLAAGFVNAAAVAASAARASAEINAPITVLACGERWHSLHEEGDLRFALEDYLGAGAVVSSLLPWFTRSPEALIGELAFTAAAHRLPEILSGCGSGRELIDRGYAGDVEQAARLNIYAAAPVLREGMFFARSPG
jgi:2-phosphosulfolactate phosphatase